MGMKKFYILTSVLVAIIIVGVFYSDKLRGSSVLPAQPITAIDISRAAADFSAPLTRDGNKVVINLQTTEVTAEIMPGVTYEYWTFNGTVPGPFLRVKEGDDVVVRLAHVHAAYAEGDSAHSFALDSFVINEVSANGGAADGHMAGMVTGHAEHSVDLHAVTGPGGGAVYTKVAPNETNAFQFKATRPGLYIYHCASAHIPTHVANGMYGMILVEPKGGLSKVDREFYVMQGELYTTGKFGELGHQPLDTAKLLSERPEYFVFNGRVGALTGSRALKANVGETVRIFFGVGSHIASNFHVIGGIFDRLFSEGDIISPPHRNVQTTIVPPGGAAMAEFTIEAPGKYLLVDHSLTRAIDKGALGELVVTGDEQPEIFKKVE